MNNEAWKMVRSDQYELLKFQWIIIIETKLIFLNINWNIFWGMETVDLLEKKSEWITSI